MATKRVHQHWGWIFIILLFTNKNKVSENYKKKSKYKLFSLAIFIHVAMAIFSLAHYRINRHKIWNSRDFEHREALQTLLITLVHSLRLKLWPQLSSVQLSKTCPSSQLKNKHKSFIINSRKKKRTADVYPKASLSKFLLLFEFNFKLSKYSDFSLGLVCVTILIANSEKQANYPLGHIRYHPPSNAVDSKCH